MPPLEPPSIPEPARRRAAALSVCLSVAATSLSPTLVVAAPAEDAGSATAEAEAIFRRGQAKYETADYNGAIELWTEAYALVDSTPQNASIKALLIFNLAQAHTKAYELDEDPIHLKQAKRLLSSYRDNLELLYEDREALEAEYERVDEEIAEIDAKLAKLEEPEPAPRPEPPPPQVEAPVDDQPPVPGKSGTPLIAAGGALVGLGVAAGVVGIVGGVLGSGANDISDLDPDDLVAREDRFARGRSANVLLVVGAVGAGLLLPTGAALIGVGVKRNKRLDTAKLRLSPSFAGSWGAGGGLSLTGQF